MTGWLGEAQTDPRASTRSGLRQPALLLALGDVIVGWLLQRQAEVALRKLARQARTGLLRRQGRGGPVLRPRGAAPHRRRPPDHRGHHPRPDGPPGRGLLTRGLLNTSAVWTRVWLS